MRKKFNQFNENILRKGQTIDNEIEYKHMYQWSPSDGHWWKKEHVNFFVQ